MRESGLLSIGPNLAKSTVGTSGRPAPPPAGRALPAAAERRFQIVLGDAALFAGAVELREIEAELARQPAHRGAGVDAGEVGEFRRRRLRRRRLRCAAGGGLAGFRRNRFGVARGRRLGRGGARRRQRQDDSSLAHFIADFDAQLADHAVGGRGHVHRRLVGFQRHQRLLGLHLIAGLDQDLDDRHVVKIADVGHFHFARRRGGRGLGFRRRLGFLRRLVGLGGRRGAVLQCQDQRAHRHFVAELGEDLLDDALHGRGHVHRGLVGFQRHQRLLGLHLIARLDQDLDDRHVVEIADVGNFHFDLRQGFLPRAIS